jgi:hypothetical protein
MPAANLARINKMLAAAAEAASKQKAALAKRKSRAAKKKSKSKKVNRGNIGLKALGFK